METIEQTLSYFAPPQSEEWGNMRLLFRNGEVLEEKWPWSLSKYRELSHELFNVWSDARTVKILVPTSAYDMTLQLLEDDCFIFHSSPRY